jgi:tetratricopeptide (TPR) repeat protein
MNTRKHIVICLLAASAVAGCQSSGDKSSNRQEPRWDSARSGVLLNVASDQFDASAFDKARRTLDEIFKLTPDNPGALLLLVRIELESGRLENAHATLERVRVLAPELSDVDYLAGIIAQRWKRFDEAEASFARAYEREPDDLAYMLAYSELMAGNGRLEEAIRLLEPRVSQFDQTPALRDALARMLEQAGRDEEAVEHYRRAVVAEGADASIRERLALTLFRLERFDDALGQLNRLDQDGLLDGRVDLQTMRADCLAAAGRLPEARTIYESAARTDPTYVPAFRGLARTALTEGDRRRAGIAIAKATALDPRDPQTIILAGCIDLAEGRTDAARAAFERALAIDPSNALAVTLLGLLHERAGNTVGAAEAYSSALRLEPGEPLARQLIVELGDR